MPRYEFSEQQAERLARATRGDETRLKARGRNVSRGAKGLALNESIAKTGPDDDDDVIPARDGKKPGKKTEVQLYQLDDPDAEEPQLVKRKDENGEDLKVTVFNLSGSEVSAGAYLMVRYFAGCWWVVFEDCTPDDSDDDESED